MRFLRWIFGRSIFGMPSNENCQANSLHSIHQNAKVAAPKHITIVSSQHEFLQFFVIMKPIY